MKRRLVIAGLCLGAAPSVALASTDRHPLPLMAARWGSFLSRAKRMAGFTSSPTRLQQGTSPKPIFPPVTAVLRPCSVAPQPFQSSASTWPALVTTSTFLPLTTGGVTTSGVL